MRKGQRLRRVKLGREDSVKALPEPALVVRDGVGAQDVAVAAAQMQVDLMNTIQ